MIKMYVVIDGDYKLCNLCYFGVVLYNIVINFVESIDYLGSDLSWVVVM